MEKLQFLRGCRLDCLEGKQMNENTQKRQKPLYRGEPYHAKNWKKIKLEHTINSSLNKIPPLKRFVLKITQNYRLINYQRQSKRLMNDIGNKFDIDKIFWLTPKQIYYTSIKEFDVLKDKGKIIDGDWDLLERPFEKISVFVAFQERFVEEKSWNTTAYYHRILKKIEDGEYLWGCKNKSDLDKRFKNLEQIFQNIKNNGYKLQPELFTEKKIHNSIKFDDEITVNIGRHGDLLFNNGAHRLSIAKLLNVEKIPIKITVRHPEWVNFKKQILLYAQDQKHRKIYQPISHIDLQDVPSFFDKEIDRFELIQRNLSVKTGRLLDIGSHWGYFCHRFEDIGFECYAVENDQVNIYFLEKLKRAKNKNFTIIPKSIFESEEIEKTSFDVVLGLSVFHHFLKNEEDYKKFVTFLKNLQVKELYFQPHCPSERQMENAYKNYSEEEFVDFILKHLQLKNVKYIGKTEHERKMYKIY